MFFSSPLHEMLQHYNPRLFQRELVFSEAKHREGGEHKTLLQILDLYGQSYLNMHENTLYFKPKFKV